MSVRVVARVRPLLKSERELDVILRTDATTGTADSKSRQSTGDKKSSGEGDALAALRDRDNLVRIPNPKNEGEEYAFQFNAVYDSDASQQELFDAEGTSYLPLKCIRRLIEAMLQLHPRPSTCSTDLMSPSSHTVLPGPAKHTRCAVGKPLPTAA